jgi:hypothetical protein
MPRALGDAVSELRVDLAPQGYGPLLDEAFDAVAHVADDVVPF